MSFRVNRKNEWKKSNTYQSQSPSGSNNTTPDKTSDSTYSPEQNYDLGFHVNTSSSHDTSSPDIAVHKKKSKSRKRSHSPDVTPKKKARKSSKNLWTPTKEERLVAMWEEEEHMYNAMSLDYRNSIMRKQTLDRFAAVFDTTGQYI